MKIEKVLVIGSGLMAQQIALHHALHGFQVTQYGRREAGLAESKAAQQASKKSVQSIYTDLTDADFEQALTRISYTTDLEAACDGADLVTESVTEDLVLKQKIFADLEKFCPESAILTTNTSTMPPSLIAAGLKRPEKFLALHYSSPVWVRPMAEIMRLSNTADNVIEQVVEFSQNNRLLPLRLEKEHPGYILNSLLAPMVYSALEMLAKGVATHQDIDRTWMLNFPAMGLGPCGMLDSMGYNSLYAVGKLRADAEPGNPNHQLILDYIQENFIDKGRLGMTTGQGLYSYPNPEFLEPNFVNKQ